MGEDKSDELRLSFDPRIRVQFVGSKITSDAGLLAYREMDEKLGLTSNAVRYLADTRTGRNIQHHLVPLLRQSVYSRLAGYPDMNDADRLARDPAMRTAVGRRASGSRAAARNTLGRFETEILTTAENRRALAQLNSSWVSAALANTRTRRIILDMDSSEGTVHGSQEGARYNGHFESVC